MEKKQTHIMYGLIIGIIMAVFYLVLYLAGLAFKTGMNYISYIPFLIGIILNANAYSKANDGFVTFGNVFGSGFKVSMVVSIVMIVWSFLSVAIFPEMKEKAMTVVREQMAKNPKVTDEQIDAYITMMKKYWTAFMIAGSIFGTLFWGAIFSLIGAAVAKKKGPKPIADTF